LLRCRCEVGQGRLHPPDRPDLEARVVQAMVTIAGR
jgi:hypothetical protein